MDGTYGFGNRKGIGIEHCENSDGDFKKTVSNGMALIRWIRKELNKDLPVEPHKKFSSYGKNCPSNILQKWNQYINDINQGGESAPVTSKPKPHKTEGKEVYDGNSIVDYLESVGEDSSFANRQRLAEQHGISGYKGTALQNIELLDKLRSGASRIDDKKVKDLSTIAQEVIDGNYDNYPERKRLLEADGYDYNEVQREVDRIIKGESVVPKSYKPELKEGDKVTVSILYKDSATNSPSRRSPIGGYIEYINHDWNNPYRLVRRKGTKEWLGFARKKNLKK